MEVEEAIEFLDALKKDMKKGTMQSITLSKILKEYVNGQGVASPSYAKTFSELPKDILLRFFPTEGDLARFTTVSKTTHKDFAPLLRKHMDASYPLFNKLPAPALNKIFSHLQNRDLVSLAKASKYSNQEVKGTLIKQFTPKSRALMRAFIELYRVILSQGPLPLANSYGHYLTIALRFGIPGRLESNWGMDLYWKNDKVKLAFMNGSSQLYSVEGVAVLPKIDEDKIAELWQSFERRTDISSAPYITVIAGPEAVVHGHRATSHTFSNQNKKWKWSYTNLSEIDNPVYAPVLKAINPLIKLLVKFSRDIRAGPV